MRNKNKSRLSIKSFISNVAVNPLLQVVIIAIAAIIILTGLYWLNKDNSISIEENKKIDITPTMIKSITDIGLLLLPKLLICFQISFKLR